MTYQEYFRQADFNEVWKTLHDVYGESKDTRPLYQAVFEAVKDMGKDVIHSTKKIYVHLSPDGEVRIKGAPDPQEWLVGRKIVVDFDYKNIKEKDASEMVGHLLYWSTLYGIKTHRMQEEGFSKWLHEISRGTCYPKPDNELSKINHKSCDRKKLRYWESTILNDEAYDWSWNFTILHKKLEYNIGYYRFTQRYVGWEKDVDRMVLACRLMEIVQKESYKDIYVNIRNCERFKMKQTDFEDQEFLDVHRKDLRAEKAYRLVWTVLSQNMKKWWD